MQDPSLRDKMAETLGMKSHGFGTRQTGQTKFLDGDDSAYRRALGGSVSQGQYGQTPSVMSPIQRGTGIGLNVGENTMYSMHSPLDNSAHAQHLVDPVRGVEDQIRE